MSAPGWYSEPGNQELERYWDGYQWTPATRPFTPPARPPRLSEPVHRPAPYDTAAEPQAADVVAPRRRFARRSLLLVAVGVVVVAAGIALALVLISGNSGPTSFTATGTFDLAGPAFSLANEDGNYMAKNGRCFGANGYDDIPYDISDASIGYTAHVDATVTAGGHTGSCSTSFTPEN